MRENKEEKCQGQELKAHNAGPWQKYIITLHFPW